MGCGTGCKEIQVGSIGVEFTLSIVDCHGDADTIPEIESATFVFKPPGLTSFERDAVVTGTVLTYTSLVDEFTTAGVWQYQGALVFTNGSSARSSIRTFTVVRSL